MTTRSSLLRPPLTSSRRTNYREALYPVGNTARSKPTPTVTLAPVVDYGYAQSELCWGDTAIAEPEIIRVLQGIKNIGGSRVRMGVQVGSWSDLDRAIRLSVQYGIKPLLCMINNGNMGWDGTVNGYAKMCGAVATRYGPLGTNQVSEYELFNEANDVVFNSPQVDPATHATWLKAGYNAIKAVHSSSTVISGGTVPTTPVAFGWAYDPVTWYTMLYAAGAKNFMDAVGYHWYTTGSVPTPADFRWKFLSDLRTLMNSQGDSTKKIWITEIGVGVPNDTDNLTTAATWMQLMVNAVETYGPFGPLGPFFVYSYRNPLPDVNNPNAEYGVVDFDWVPRQPYYAYLATVNSGTAPAKPPAPTAVAFTGVTYFSATFTCDQSTDAAVVGYRVYVNGVLSAQQAGPAATVEGLNAGTPYSAYMTTVNGAGLESAQSNSVSFTTNAPQGLQAFYQYQFTGTGSALPTVFSQLGLGFAVASGVALPHTSAVDGEFFTVAPYTLPCQSVDHYCQISQSIASAYSDRAAIAPLRMAPDGSQWAAAVIYGDGRADACQIITFQSGAWVIRDACDAEPLLPSQSLVATALGNTYTVTVLDATNNPTSLMTWTDINGVYLGAANRYPGIGWHHKRVGGVNYAAPGITGLWKSADISPVTPSAGVSDAWMLAVVPDDDWGQLITTGSWPDLI